MWRLIGGESAPVAGGPTNMAVDAALLDAVRGGAPPVVRLYRWAPPTLSFGRNQPAAGLYDLDAAGARGIAFVRRPTGGQAVLHADELTYAVVAPVGVIGRPRTAYRRINEALVAGLRRVGLPAELSAGAAAGDHDWSAACFQRPVAGELVVGGRKLVGSAQRTEGRVILQHGSILIDGSQAAAEELLLDAARAPAAGAPAGPGGWTTLVEAMGRRPDPDSLASALVAGFRDALGITLAPSELTPVESKAADRLREGFSSSGWTWRR